MRRYDTVDALRGVAMVWMTVFHFCFDLSHFGLWPQNFRAGSFWTAQRTMIVSLFLFALGSGRPSPGTGAGWRQVWAWVECPDRRVRAAGICQVVCDVSSQLHLFGVLHGMAVMLLIARCTAGWGRCCGSPDWWRWPCRGLHDFWRGYQADPHALVQWASPEFAGVGFPQTVPRKTMCPMLPWLGVSGGGWPGQWRCTLARVGCGARLPPAHAFGNAGAVEPELLHGPSAGDDWPAKSWPWCG